jgi:membrane protease YdiL (CAAX protease family)
VTKIWAYIGLAYALSWPLLSRSGASHSGVSQPDRRRRFLWFIAMTLLGWIVLVFTSEWRGVRAHWPVQIKFWLIAPAMLPAWVISGAFSKDRGIHSLLRSLVHPPDWRWPAVALLSMPAFLLVPSVLVHMFGVPFQWPAPQNSAWMYIASGIVRFGYSLLFAAVLEEPGWRGFLLERLQCKFSPLAASLLVWLPWALWHAPLDFGGWVANSLILYLEIRVIFLIPLTILTTWIYNREGQNVASFRCRLRAPFRESTLQVGGLDGFGDVIVHAGFQALFAGSRDGVRCGGNNGDSGRGDSGRGDSGRGHSGRLGLAQAYFPGGRITVHLRHSAVHEDRLIGKARGHFHRVPAVDCHIHQAT